MLERLTRKVNAGFSWCRPVVPVDTICGSYTNDRLTNGPRVGSWVRQQIRGSKAKGNALNCFLLRPREIVTRSCAELYRMGPDTVRGENAMLVALLVALSDYAALDARVSFTKLPFSAWHNVSTEINSWSGWSCPPNSVIFPILLLVLKAHGVRYQWFHPLLSLSATFVGKHTRSFRVPNARRQRIVLS